MGGGREKEKGREIKVKRERGKQGRKQEESKGEMRGRREGGRRCRQQRGKRERGRGGAHAPAFWNKRICSFLRS